MRRAVKRGLYLTPFDELANPRLLADLARAAESVGWDGLFLWDRIAYPPRERPVADPLGGFWSGGFRLLPVQSPRVPVWVAASWPNRRPVRQAIRWDGLFPIDLPGPEGLAELAEEVRQARAGSDDPFDLVVEVPPGGDVHAWEAAGATWALTSVDPQPSEPEVRAVVDAGP
jgi:alkanesulfonate monooxygenase SsuD/methylene tetrahydromethanopterin reductase-like flavin-dependent oxidoreductase (luciferase family)